MELECRESNLFDEMQAATDGFGERQTAKRSESVVERFSRCEHFLNTVKNGYKKAKLLNDQDKLKHESLILAQDERWRRA